MSKWNGKCDVPDCTDDAYHHGAQNSYCKPHDTRPTTMTRIDKLRAIVSERQWSRVEGYEVDLFTATLLVQLHDNISRKSQETFQTCDFKRLVNLAWKRAKETPSK